MKIEIIKLIKDFIILIFCIYAITLYTDNHFIPIILYFCLGFMSACLLSSLEDFLIKLKSHI